MTFIEKLWRDIIDCYYMYFFLVLKLVQHCMLYNLNQGLKCSCQYYSKECTNVKCVIRISKGLKSKVLSRKK